MKPSAHRRNTSGLPLAATHPRYSDGAVVRARSRLGAAPVGAGLKIWIALLATLGFSGTAWAQVGAEACVDVQFETQCMTGPLAAAESLTRVLSSGTSYRLAIGSAEVGPGRLHAVAYGNGEQLSASAQGIARFDDILTINGPVPPGTFGRFTARMRVDGALQAASYNYEGQPGQGFARAIVISSLRGGPGLFFEANMSAERTSTGTATGLPSSVLEVDVDFQFGQPFPLRLTLQAFAQGNGQGFGVGAAGLARSAYGSSAYWLGITEVEAEGDPLAEFSVTSATGIDYRTDFSVDRVFRHGFEH